MSDSIKVSIELADKVAQKSLSDFISNADRADKSLKKLGDSGKSTFDEIAVNIGKSIGVYEIFAGNIAANVASKGFEVLKDAAVGLFNTFIVDGVKAAEESEDALNSLNVSLAQAGQYSEKTSVEFQNFAKSIQATTAFEDDLVIKNAALLQSLAQLDEKGLETATQAAINLSAALGKDLSTTTEAVAKAANGNYTALQKMGIQFDKTGSQAQNFENALKAIDSQFGGAAASKLNTFSGAVAQVKNNFGDLQEEFGNLIIKNPAFISAINAVSSVIKELTEGAFFKGVEGTKALGEGFLFVIKTAEYTIQFINGLTTAALIAFDSIIVATTSALASIVGLFAPFSDTAQTIFENLEQQANESLNKIGERLDSGGPLSGAIKVFEEIGNAAEAGFNKIGTEADATAPKIENVKNSYAKLSEEQQKQLEENNKFADSLAKKNQSIEENQKLELENLKLFYEQKDALEADADTINYQQKIEREQQFYIQRQAILDQQFAEEQNRILASTVSEQTKTQALIQVQKKYESDSLKSQTEYFSKKANLTASQDKSEITARTNTLNTFATLASSNNSFLAAIGKAAGLTQIAIATPVAVAEATKWGNSFGGPALGATFAGITYAAMAAQASKLAGLNFENGGIVPGSSFTGDRISANVNSGEMILNRRQQAELFSMAQGTSRASAISDNSETNNLLRGILKAVSSATSIQIDGREVINVVRDSLSSGRSFA